MPRITPNHLYVSAAVGLFASLPGSAFVFNVVPQTARLVAPLLCRGEFVIHPSARRSSHEYICYVVHAQSKTDITFVTSAIVWFLLWLFLLVLALLIWQVATRKRPSE